MRNAYSYEEINDYINHKVDEIKQTAKNKLINLNKKEVTKKYISSLITGEKQKVYFRVKNTNPNRRQNFLSVIRYCNKVEMCEDGENIRCYVNRGPHRCEAIYCYNIKNYGFRWAFKKKILLRCGNG